MNAIILYGSRYGASQTYAQALEARTGIPPWPTKRSRTLAPLTPSSTSAASMPVRPQGWPKPSATSPTDHPFRLLVATVGLSDPAVEDNLLRIRESLAQELSPRHLRAHHPCPPPRGHRLQRSHHPPPADDEGAVHPSCAASRRRTGPQTPRPCWTATARRWISSTWIPWPPSKPGWKRAENPVYYSTKPDRLTTLLPAGPSCFPSFWGDFPTSAPFLSQTPPLPLPSAWWIGYNIACNFFTLCRIEGA